MKKLLALLLFAPLLSYAQGPLPASGPPIYWWNPIPGVPSGGGTNIYNYYITTNIYNVYNNNAITTNINYITNIITTNINTYTTNIITTNVSNTYVTNIYTGGTTIPANLGMTMTTDQGISSSSSGSQTGINFNTVNYSTNIGVYYPVAGIFGYAIVTNAGIYEITAQTAWTSVVPSGGTGLSIQRNAGIQVSWTSNQANFQDTLVIRAVVNCNAMDHIAIFVWQNGGGNRSLDHTQTSFSIYRPAQ